METHDKINFLSSAQSIAISPNDYRYFMELKEKEASKGISLDNEPLAPEPFFKGHTDQIYLYRTHILKAYKMTENRNGWGWDKYRFTDNDFLKTASDEEFFSELEDFVKEHEL